ncbi:MAG: hypothetical protein KC731_27945, partial [Myxococcales bacterium]|nr:hypothetical protein [Myxococcales bacterium]
PGFVLTEESERLRTTAEKLGGAHLFRVEVPAGGAVDLVIEEWSPLMKTVDIRTDGGVESIGLFLRKKTVDPKLAAQIEAILKSHREAANLEERISMLAEQMQVYRERVDEINVQLMTLSKVGQAAKLRQNLQGKMQTISEKLQATTMETTELEGNLMTLRIALQDKLAELSFEEPKAKTLAAK